MEYYGEVISGEIDTCPCGQPQTVKTYSEHAGEKKEEKGYWQTLWLNGPLFQWDESKRFILKASF